MATHIYAHWTESFRKQQELMAPLLKEHQQIEDLRLLLVDIRNAIWEELPRYATKDIKRRWLEMRLTE